MLLGVWLPRLDRCGQPLLLRHSCCSRVSCCGTPAAGVARFALLQKEALQGDGQGWVETTDAAAR